MRFQQCSPFVSRAMIGVIAALTCTTSLFAVDIVDDAVQIDERAAQVVLASNTLCWEMHRYHQKQPDFTPTYRSAKQIWSQALEIRDALRAGPVETAALNERLNAMSDTFQQVEATLSKWGNGDRSMIPNNSGPTQRTVVTQGAGVDLPLLGIHVGRPQVYVEEDDTPQLARQRLHPNSPGSKRSLERELAATKVALSYLLEDANVVAPPNSTDAGPNASAATSPVPEPPTPGATLENPTPVPATSKKPDAKPVQK
ncbi:MAG: hypothetical protein JWN70_4407 [Planctomycetaceae bacterium]|nr:hypothetical protein [Planctomycetaceae bacterium]